MDEDALRTWLPPDTCDSGLSPVPPVTLSQALLSPQPHSLTSPQPYMGDTLGD
jgi:hypothetical protein